MREPQPELAASSNSNSLSSNAKKAAENAGLSRPFSPMSSTILKSQPIQNCQLNTMSCNTYDIVEWVLKSSKLHEVQRLSRV